MVVSCQRRLWEQQLLQCGLHRRGGQTRGRTDRQVRSVRFLNEYWRRKEVWKKIFSRIIIYTKLTEEKQSKGSYSPLCPRGTSADSVTQAPCYCPLLVNSWNYTWTEASPLWAKDRRVILMVHLPWGASAEDIISKHFSIIEKKDPWNYCFLQLNKKNGNNCFWQQRDKGCC